MKKLSDLSIADLNALYNYIERELAIANSLYSGMLKEKLAIKLNIIANELYSRAIEIEDFKDI